MPRVVIGASSVPSPPGLVSTVALQRMLCPSKSKVPSSKTATASSTSRQENIPRADATSTACLERVRSMKAHKSTRSCKTSDAQARRDGHHGDDCMTGQQATWGSGPLSRVESLRSSLAELDDVPAERIFLVRKIQQFGMNSANVVQKHFSAYGHVEKVYVAHSPIMTPCGRHLRRLRASNLAIVVMMRATAVIGVLREGSRQHIFGRDVLVERYLRRSDNKRSSSDKTWPPQPATPSSASDEEHLGMIFSSDRSFDDVCAQSEPLEFEYWATDDEFS